MITIKGGIIYCLQFSTRGGSTALTILVPIKPIPYSVYVHPSDTPWSDLFHTLLHPLPHSFPLVIAELSCVNM